MIATGGGEQAEGGVVAESGVDSKSGGSPPTVFGIETEAAERLRKGAIAGFGVIASSIGKSSASAIVIGDELRWIGQIESRILSELDEVFGGGSERAAKNRFVNEVYAEADGVAPGRAENVVSELVFLLIANDGERGNFRGELIVTESFETGGGVKIRAERKSKRKAEVGVAIFGVMEMAGFKSERAKPVGREAILLAEKNIEVIGSAGGTGGRKSSLLYKIVLSVIAIKRAT